MIPESVIVASSALTNNKHAAVDAIKVSFANYRRVKAMGGPEDKAGGNIRFLCKISWSCLDNLNP
jgi:hypothetical protein